MIEYNKNLKLYISSKIFIDGKEIILKRDEEKLKSFKKELEDLKSIEAMLLLNCLLTGEKIELSENKILLFSDKKQKGRIGPNWIISNKILYKLIKNFFI